MTGLKRLKNQKGSVLTIAFAAIGLMGVLAYTMMGNKSTQSMNMLKIYETENSQLTVIKNQINTCINLYPESTNGCTEGTNCKSAIYPRADVLTNVSSLSCHGAPSSLFGMPGVNNASAPVAIGGFGVWQYWNDETAEGISIRQVISDTTLRTNVVNFLTSKGHGGITVSGTTMIVTLVP